MEDGRDREFERCVEAIMARVAPSDDFLKCIDLLGIKRDQFNIIHVSGTNGKSSVAHKVSQSLISLGKKVGLFTSPHLFEYNERIRVQGVKIPNADFVRITDLILAAMGDTPLHFFSFILAMALLYFIEQKVEWVVLETGIGGLRDSTNFAPNTRVAVITSIGYDHMHMLGNSLEEIAYQKAGTIKSGCHVVLGPNCHNYEIFEKMALEVGAKVIKNAGKDFKSFDEENTETARLVVEEALGMGEAPKSSLNSRLRMRMQTLSESDLKVAKSHIFSKFPSLAESEYGLPKGIVLDIAHNQTAVARLCSDVFKLFEGNVTFCVSISNRRRLSIFNPIWASSSGDRVCRFYYLNVDHAFVRTLNSVAGDVEDCDLAPEAREPVRLGVERSRLICGSETGDFHTSNAVTDDFDKVLYNAFIECCRTGELLVLTGTVYMMKQCMGSLGLLTCD